MATRQGRPRELPEPAAARIQVILGWSDGEAFRKLAEREGKTASRLGREILEAYVKKHGSGNPAFAIDQWVVHPESKAQPNLWLIEGLGDLDKIDTKTLQEIRDKAGQLDRLATHRLQMRGEE